MNTYRLSSIPQIQSVWHQKVNTSSRANIHALVAVLKHETYTQEDEEAIEKEAKNFET